MGRHFGATLLLAALISGTLAAPSRAYDNLIKNGDFNTNGDGWTNQVVGVEGVTSEWLKDGGRDGSGGVHIRSDKGGEQAIWIWRYIIKEFPADKPLRISGWAKGKGVEQLVAIYVQGWNADRSKMADFATTQQTKPLKDDFDWTEIETYLTPSEETKRVDVLIFISGQGEVWFDDIAVTPVDQAPACSGAAVQPGLFEARGAYKLVASGKSAKPTLLIPLPMSYREQAPLTYNLVTDPPEKLKKVRVYRDQPNNYVAEVVLGALKSGETVKLEWSSIVLCGPRSFKDVPLKAALPKKWPKKARPWLKGTRCVQAEHERIAEVADEIRGDSKDVMEIIDGTLKRTAKIYSQQEGRCDGLDAVQALDKQGSCTSCANLVAALLRANGIPARILAGYPSWSGPLQTHYLVEAYVPDYGWYPIESTRLQAPWQPYQQIEVAIIPPEYEDKSQHRFCAAGGVPYLSLTEYPGHDGSFASIGTIVEKQSCDHQAKSWRPFAKSAPAEDWRKAIDAAKARWKKWLASSPTPGDDRRLTTPLQPAELKAENPAELAKFLEK
jgi:transglutaminase-like putative cysteine protease